MLNFLARLLVAAQAAKDAIFPPPPAIEAEFGVMYLQAEDEDFPRMFVYASVGDRTFAFLEGKFAAIGAVDQDETVSWDLTEAPPYDGDMPPMTGGPECDCDHEHE